MTQFSNVMEIFKLLDKSNCRECSAPTCLAFSAAVFKGEKALSECTHLNEAVLAQFEGKGPNEMTFKQDPGESMSSLKRQISEIDLASSAQRLGAQFSNDRITLKCLGKDISVDTKGNVITDIHVHSWIMIPVLDYIIEGAGRPISGQWIPFRELEGGKNWYRLFGQRCEKPLKKVADTYTDLFDDMLHVFNGRQVENHYASDISLVLYPLPKVPILICYWRAAPEEGFESDLNMFFDSTAEDNLNIESIYTLAAGLVMMFEKVALRHG